MTTIDQRTFPFEPKLREIPVDPTKRLDDYLPRRARFSPVRLLADAALAARLWFLVAIGAMVLCAVEPYLLVKAYRTVERVVVLDGTGSFSVSPLLGFEDAKELHETTALWATLAFLQRNPDDFDYPDMLQKLFLATAYQKAKEEMAKTRPEFSLKGIHQKPEVFKIDILKTRADRVLVRVEGQLVRTGVFQNQVFTEAPRFILNLTLARNPNMAVNHRYPLGVWSFDFSTL